MKLLPINYCFSCLWFKYCYHDNPTRFKCCHPEVMTKKGTPRILNMDMVSRGNFPKCCPLEDANFNIPKIADRGYSHEKTI